MEDEEEDYDELPPIKVNSSGRDLSQFTMPRAGELAAQRARAERCERELASLRERDAAPAPRAAHSDSSGSEGEAALAAAVTALRVRPAGCAPPAPALAALLAAAAPHLPAGARPFLQQYARAAGARPRPAARRAARETLTRIEGWMLRAARDDALRGDEAAACAAWLCLALAADERAALGAAGARAAHCLLREAAPAAAALEPALLAAVPAPRARLELADALRCGGAGPDRLAGRLVLAALGDLLEVAPDSATEEEWESGGAARWRRLGAAAQHTALQLAARAREGGAAGPARLLAALLAATPAARDLAPDSLKVDISRLVID